MEYACKVAGSKVIVVLGHEGCGAVKAACDSVELGNITSLLSNISPSVQAVKNDISGPYDSGNDIFVNAAIKENVSQTISKIREMSPILSSLEENNDITNIKQTTVFIFLNRINKAIYIILPFMLYIKG